MRLRPALRCRRGLTFSLLGDLHREARHARRNLPQRRLHPFKILLNNSHLYHQILHDSKHRGIEVGDVKLNLQQLMKAKEQSVAGLTKGVEFLLKKNGVEYIKGTGTFQDEHTIKVALNDGGETSVVGKNIIIATGSEATPFPGLQIDEQRVITSTGAIALEKIPEKMLVIGGGIIGLEMASVWSRLGSQVTVVEFLDQIGGPGMDTEISKQIQKLLKKQGINFKTGTKVLSGDTAGSLIKLDVDSAKGGKAETVGTPFLHSALPSFPLLLPPWFKIQPPGPLLPTQLTIR